MIGNETQNTPGLPLVAADDLWHFRPEQIGAPRSFAP